MAGNSKGRKLGNKKKQPAMKRYVAERRLEKNKRIAVEKAEKRRAKDKDKTINVAKGSARVKKRLPKQKAWAIAASFKAADALKNEGQQS